MLCLQVIGFFSARLEQAGSDLSVEQVQEVIRKGAVALPRDRLKVSISRQPCVFHLFFSALGGMETTEKLRNRLILRINNCTFNKSLSLLLQDYFTD